MERSPRFPAISAPPFASCDPGQMTGACKPESLHLFLFFFRKISPELTAANPPLFAEEDWPRADIRAHLPLVYMWDTYHSMACQVVPCLHPGSEPGNPGPPK